MGTEKQRLILEVAYDLISRVHSEICRTAPRGDTIMDDSLEILRKILLLDRKLKGGDE
jgi:hypothetical protein